MKEDCSSDSELTMTSLPGPIDDAVDLDTATRRRLWHAPNANQTPLENAVVIDNIFTFCTIKDLKVIRSVGRKWNSHATPVLFRLAWCNLFSECHPDQHHDHAVACFIKRSKFLPGLKSFQKFRLNLMNLTDGNIMTTRIVDFFGKFGRNIRTLSIRGSRLDQGGQFWTNLIRVNKWTSNLTELILESNCYIVPDGRPDLWGLPSRHRITKLAFYSDKSNGAMPCPLTNFWKEFPGLESLQLIDLTEEENLILLEAKNPAKMKNSKPPLVLKELDMFGESEFSVRELPKNQLKLFCELKLPLTKLTIDVGENILAGNFQQLLLAYAPTLKDLVVWRGLLATKMKLPGFPFGVTLPRLQYLEVPESCILNFNFIHLLPKLYKLNVRQCDLNPLSYETDLFLYRYSYAEWRQFVREPHLNVQELQVEFTIKDENLEFLRGIFPNLRLFTGFVSMELELQVF